MMYKNLLFVSVFACLISCKENNKIEPEKSEVQVSETIETRDKPSYISEVLKAHGGLDQWNTMNSLYFERGDEESLEKNTFTLKDRKSIITTSNWEIGHDGENVWLNEKGETYKGNARFYHNLFFYFYAMPFVLADEGIIYTEMPSETILGTKYNVVKIAYSDGVGDSSKDEYLLYSNPETNKMEWLGYTVTFKDNEKSSDFHFINYSDWQDVNGLILPSTLTWYNVENGKPLEKRNDMNFRNVSIKKSILNDSIFKMPETAKTIKR